MLTILGFSSLREFVGEHISRWGNDKWLCCQDVMAHEAETSIEEKGEDGHYYLTTRKPIVRNNEVQGVLGISIDITDQKQAELAKIEFLQNIQHDIRTPFSGIVHGARLIQEHQDTPKELKGWSETVATSTKAFLDFLNQILEAASAAGEFPVARKAFSLKNTLESVLKLLLATANEKHLFLSFKYDVSVPDSFLGDALRIKRIVLELVTNAVKFTEKGHVEASAQLIQRTGQCAVVQISVEDSGIGILAEKHDAIFHRFTRLTAPHRGVYPGVGLGLFGVSCLIKDLHGEIKVKSAPNKGSTFTCILPLEVACLEAGDNVCNKKDHRAWGL